MSEKVNFRIVENPRVGIDYENFKKDFLNPHISKDELIEKYELTMGRYMDYRARVKEETGLSKKPFIYNGGRSNSLGSGSEYIRKINGYYTVVKTFKYNAKNYGSFDDYETAVMVRDKLVESNWDETLAFELKQKYGRKRRKPALEKAEEIYDEFKKYYFDTSIPLKQVFKELGITQSMYSYLLNMIQDEYNINRRCKLV